MTDKELIQIKRAIDLAEKITDLVLKQGYDGQCMGEEFAPVMGAIIAYDSAKRVQFRDITAEEYKNYYTFDEFLIEVEEGYFTDYDGHGKLAKLKKVSDIIVNPSNVKDNQYLKPEWATHVVWYNS